MESKSLANDTNARVFQCQVTCLRDLATSSQSESDFDFHRAVGCKVSVSTELLQKKNQLVMCRVVLLRGVLAVTDMPLALVFEDFTS